MACCPGDFDASDRGVDDIIDVHKVPGLKSVLEYIDLIAILYASGEYGEDAGVGVGQRLARTVDILIPECDRINSYRLAAEMYKLSLDLFCDPIHTCGMDSRILSGGHKLQRCVTALELDLEIAV